MPVLFKKISPSSFNDKAIYASLVSGMNDVVDEANDVFQSTVKDFSSKPNFEKNVKTESNKISGSVLTDDENYRRLNYGTRPHVIRPRRPGGMLVFRVPFKSKTTLTRLPSRAGSRGNNVIFARKVNHPGFKARKYEDRVTSKMKKPFNKIMNASLNTGAKKSGHSM
jgi:hypothetical protein